MRKRVEDIQPGDVVLEPAITPPKWVEVEEVERHDPCDCGETGIDLYFAGDRSSWPRPYGTMYEVRDHIDSQEAGR